MMFSAMLMDVFQDSDTGLFLYCYERDFMDSLNHDNQANVIEAFNSTSRYLDDLLNTDNPYFEGMVNQIYSPELQLNKANISDTEAPFLDLHLSVSKIYDKRDDFDFDIVNVPFLDGDVPRRASYGVLGVSRLFGAQGSPSSGSLLNL